MGKEIDQEKANQVAKMKKEGYLVTDIMNALNLTYAEYKKLNTTKSKSSVKVYNKLVRDNIPSIIEESGKIAHYRTLDDDGEYRAALMKKLIEEANEVTKAVKRDHLIEEIGDVMTVLATILDFHGIDLDDVINNVDEKAEEKGTFINRCFLETVEKKV